MDPIVPSELLDDDDPSVDDKVEEDTATFWLLLDFGAEPTMTEEEDLPLTLEEDFALPLLLLDFAELLLDFGSEPGMTEEEDSSSSFGATLLLSSPHAVRRSKQDIATTAMLPRNDIFIFFIQVPCLRTMP